MIRIKNIDMLVSILGNLSSSGGHYQLFGNTSEHFPAVSVLSSDNPKTRLKVNIVALTSIGTIYLNQFVDLSDAENVNSIKEKISALSITEADIQFDSTNGTINFK